MKVKDEELFADRKLARSGGLITKLLTSCWEQTLDAGPYSFINSDTPIDWDRIASADRNYLLIKLRVSTFGSDYEFKVTCNKCAKHFAWGVDLNSLDVFEMSEEGISSLRTGDAVPMQVDGMEVLCRVLRGEDERFFATLDGAESNKVLTYTLTRRIVQMQGQTEWELLLPLVEDLERLTADKLWDLTDNLEGGIEMLFDIDCPSCQTVMNIMLPFEEGFFSSRKRFAKSKRKRIG